MDVKDYELVELVEADAYSSVESVQRFSVRLDVEPMLGACGRAGRGWYLVLDVAFFVRVFLARGEALFISLNRNPLDDVPRHLLLSAVVEPRGARVRVAG